MKRFAGRERPRNDSGEQASKDGERPSLEVGLLAELRAALAERGIGAELREDLECLAVKMTEHDSGVWVFVNLAAGTFRGITPSFSTRSALCKARLNA